MASHACENVDIEEAYADIVRTLEEKEVSDAELARIVETLKKKEVLSDELSSIVETVKGKGVLSVELSSIVKTLKEKGVSSNDIAGIVKTLKEKGVKLVGEAGIGKTWMAHEICKRATREDGPCYISLWLNLNKEMDEMSLYKDIASQLSLFIEEEESEEDDSDDEESIQDAKERNDRDLITLQYQIKKELDQKKLKRGKKRYLLLVLDDEGRVTNEEKVMKVLYLRDFLAPYGPVKMLLTIRNGDKDAEDSDKKIESHAHTEEEIQSNAMYESHVLPADFHTDMSHILRKTFSDDNLMILLEFLIKDELHESLEKAWGKDYGFLKHRIVDMSLGLPAAVVVLAKSLNCIAPFCLSPKLDEVFKIMLRPSFPSRRNPVLHLAYELLKADNNTMKPFIVDCFWHSLSFFDHCGCVNYQELIAHWILEGYFDPVRSVTKAYNAGHAILMELMNRGFLKIQEDNVVMPEVAMKNVIDLRRRGLSGTSRIGLAKVFGCDMTKGIGKINQVDDIIEAVRATRKGEKITTVLVSGNRLSCLTREKFFEKHKDLEIIGLFQPTVAHFVSFLVKLVKLRVLVIRDCDLLDDIERLKALEGLHVLEVSGASSLKEISNDFFKAMTDLRSLHLSGLHITSSPSSISELKKLHSLIIRDCPLLEDLPDIQELVNLEVVDVSGARRLQTCFDNTPGDWKDRRKNKNFYHLKNLQLLDFSGSQIERLPMFQDSAVGYKIHSLTRLLLRDCSKLKRLSSLKPLSGLQILDLSGTTSLLKIMEECFEDKQELRILNLSGSNIPELPCTIKDLSSLSELLLKGCTNLEVLPSIQELTTLEVIDVSGCTRLEKMEGLSECMSYLREVNLSGTKVETPKFPEESKLCCTKRIILADKRRFEGEDWSHIAKRIISETFEKASSSDAVVTSLDISEKESTEIQSSEPLSCDFPRKRGISKDFFHHFYIYQNYIYQKSIPFVDSESHPKVLEFYGSNGLSGLCDLENEALADAKYVSFVNTSSAKLGYIFDELRSVKGCWIRMCKDIKDLFSGVDEECLGSLETLAITNLQLLETISWTGSFKNLKKLSIDCCPNIRALFPEAAQVPSNLEVLHIKCCEKLEKVFEEGIVSTLVTLCLHDLPVLSDVGAKLPKLKTFKKRSCPKLPDEDLEGLDHMVDCIEAVPQD